ncbi:transposase [Gemmatimonas sp. UBA7669]|uniref:transposase n=1 Tax=Gemmatimonas sp. UBA7669 TaxID=1946568 RepID=UPI0039C88092
MLQLLYSIRSERQLVWQLGYNLLYCWFVGLDLEVAAWYATTFTKHRQRLLEGDIAAQCLARTVATAERARLLSPNTSRSMGRRSGPGRVNECTTEGR